MDISFRDVIGIFELHIMCGENNETWYRFQPISVQKMENIHPSAMSIIHKYNSPSAPDINTAYINAVQGFKGAVIGFTRPPPSVE